MMLPFSGVSADLGEAQVKGFDLYVKLHAKDLEPYKLDLIKRLRRRAWAARPRHWATPISRRARIPPTPLRPDKTVATELITIERRRPVS
jgi:hypothetical protein